MARAKKRSRRENKAAWARYHAGHGPISITIDDIVPPGTIQHHFNDALAYALGDLYPVTEQEIIARVRSSVNRQTMGLSAFYSKIIDDEIIKVLSMPDNRIAGHPDLGIFDWANTPDYWMGTQVRADEKDPLTGHPVNLIPPSMPPAPVFSILRRFQSRHAGMADKPEMPTFWQEEPVVAWRAWQMDGALSENQWGLEGGRWRPKYMRLKSFYHPNIVWEPRVKHTAVCDVFKDMALNAGLDSALAWHPHIPDVACECGIYAFREPDDLLRQMSIFGLGGVVIGRLAMWGRTIETRGAKGYRCLHAYPVDLSIVELPHWARSYSKVEVDVGPVLARGLETEYGVPCTWGRKLPPPQPLVG